MDHAARRADRDRALKLVRRYYDRVDARKRTVGPLRFAERRPPVVIVATAGRSRLSDEALRFALDLSPDVVAVHLTSLEGEDDSAEVAALREAWRNDVQAPAEKAGLLPPRLVVLPATYRRVEEPLLELIDEMRPKLPGRRVAILIPELIKRRWYQHLLHTHRARRLRARLLSRGDPDIVGISISWDPEPEASLGKVACRAIQNPPRSALKQIREQASEVKAWWMSSLRS